MLHFIVQPNGKGAWEAYPTHYPLRSGEGATPGDALIDLLRKHSKVAEATVYIADEPKQEGT